MTETVTLALREIDAGLRGDRVAAYVAAAQTLAAGLGYYNEAALVTAVGSASMRVSKQFTAGRKLCKTHQNVLVFVKGDWRKATRAVERDTTQKD